MRSDDALRAGTRLTRILVADDDVASVELLRALLEADGYEVAAAMDGNRAVEMGMSGDYEVAVIDVHMPMYDGIEVLQMLRRRHVLHPIKIIAVTADPTDSLRADLEEAGVDGYMIKPVDLQLLLEKVRALAGSGT